MASNIYVMGTCQVLALIKQKKQKKEMFKETLQRLRYVLTKSQINLIVMNTYNVLEKMHLI